MVLRKRSLLSSSKTGPGEWFREIDPHQTELRFRHELDVGSMSTFSTLGFASQLLNSLRITGDVLAVLALDELDEVLHEWR